MYHEPSPRSHERGDKAPQLLGLREILEAATLYEADQLHSDMALLDSILDPYEFEGSVGDVRLLQKIERNYSGDDVGAVLSYAIGLLKARADEEKVYRHDAAHELSMKYRNALFCHTKDGKIMEIQKIEVVAEDSGEIVLRTLDGVSRIQDTQEILIDVSRLDAGARQSIDQYCSDLEITYVPHDPSY